MLRLKEYLSLRRISSGAIGFVPGKSLKAFSPQPWLSRRAGVSLIELMVALSVLTIGVVGLMGTFKYIQKTLQSSKNHTLASNLAQEKMQILKQKSYYQVIVTTAPAHSITDFAPESVEYDMEYFPPEEIMEGGVAYTRYTFVQAVKETSGVLSMIAPNIPDVGMKRITINVVWGTGNSKRKVTVRSILTNQNTIMAYSIFDGTVKTTAAVALNGALVQLVESAGYNCSADSSGQYVINTTPGNYTMMASSTGYYSVLTKVVVAAGKTVTTPFNLTKIATGTIVGTPWLTDHLVISQVVGSTVNSSVFPHFDQEYVEVFNPSTYTWTMGTAGTTTGNIGLIFQRASESSEHNIQINYVNPEILPGGYYLFANTTTVVAGGEIVDADAVWSAGNSNFDFPYFVWQKNIIPVAGDDAFAGIEGGGALKLALVSGGAVLDKAGWSKTSHPAPFSEGSPVISDVNTGLSRGEVYGRISSTSDISGVNMSYGPAYDSNNNSVDFSTLSVIAGLPPHGHFSGVKTVISGTPAAGAVVFCSDGLSKPIAAVLSGSPPSANFSLVNVATGSWTVLITSGVYCIERSSVTLPHPGGTVYTFVSSTTLLTQSNYQGIITGRVVDVYGGPLNNKRITSGGGNSTYTGTDGRYILRVTPGIVDIMANPSTGGDYTYVTASSITISMEAGQLHSGVDFVLYQGARVRGFITRDGTHGLPGIAVAVTDSANVAKDQKVSGSDGYFTSVVLSTGYYVVQPAVDKLEASNPVSSTITLLSVGATQFSSTFTISGALGYITGSVKYGGQPIQTGVLIAVTATTLGTPPVLPDLSAATLTGSAFYLVSSMENGNYLAEVRESATPYNVYAFYSVPDSAGAVTYTSKITASVTAGQTTSGVNFSW